MSLVARLAALEKRHGPVRVAVIGAGQMGSGVVEQTSHLPGLRVAAICDLAIERARAAAERGGLPAGVADGPEDAEALMREGRTCLAAQAEWVADVPGIDVVVDATGEPEAGARLGFATISRRRPFVTMNIEADVTVGPLLAWMARRAGTVYTVAAGDEPTVLCEMIEFARAIGLEVVCAGKGKNNRLDQTVTAEEVAGEAAARGMSPRMLAAFVDGTKTMAEMAALSNATGLRPDRPGMHGPRANLADVLTIFVPESCGGILSQAGAVEYAIGDVAPGVFLVVTARSEHVRRDLAYLKMGEGPYHLLHRPFHLASLEAPLSIARAVLDGDATMAAQGAPVAECVAAAKRDLRAGEIVDGIGGAHVYGLAATAAGAVAARSVPIGVVQRARVLRDVARGSVLTQDDVALDDHLMVVQLRRIQDHLARRDALGP
jgi:predicted homoserine dehydrogenase-like protein